MLTKPPDYMISDCGCPELWSATSESKHLHIAKLNNTFWNSYTTWCNNKSTQLTKLLPLRETWTDYYTRRQLQKQNEESHHKYNRLTTQTLCGGGSGSGSDGISSAVKQQKNHHNETMKKRSFHNSSKRLNDAFNGLTNTQRKSHVKSQDNEIDQF